MGMKLKAWITCMNGSVNPGKLNQRKAYFSFFGEYICADKPIRQIWLSNNFLFSISNPKVFLMFISHHIFSTFKAKCRMLPLIELYSLKMYSIWINYVKFLRDTFLSIPMILNYPVFCVHWYLSASWSWSKYLPPFAFVALKFWISGIKPSIIFQSEIRVLFERDQLNGFKLH